MGSAAMAYLAVCAIYRNEADYLREWIEFHRLVGVERFFLYDNESTDAHREVLAPYVERGIATVEPWPQFPGQMTAYEHCLKTHREDARWIAFIDLDEFLFSPTGEPVPDLLAKYEQSPGVVVNWALFGSSGHVARPERLVIESYVRRTDDPNFNHQVKSIVDPRRVANFCGPHFFTYRDGLAVDENGRPVKPRNTTDSVSFARLRVNHYVTKSREEFERKLESRKADTGTLREVRNLERRLRLLDEVPDESILIYLDHLRRALADRTDSKGSEVA
jgi:glycosyl transferase family 92